MRTVKNKVRLLLSIIVIVVAIALFKANINSNVLYIKTQELINRTGWFQPNDRPIGSLTLSSPSYYGSDVNNPLAPNTNYANKVEEIRYGLNTQAITDANGIQYGIVYDNTNNDSPYTEDEYPDEIYDPAHPNGKKKLRLKYASTIDTTNANAYESNIAQNSDRYTVLYRDNKITVKDKNIIPYIGGNINDVAKKWVGILVDLNVRVVGTSGYNIEDVDYTDAARWGAKSDTTFIMWLTTERGGTYTFAQADDETKTITIEVEFVQEEIGLKDVSPLDYEYLNKEAFTTEFVNNKITVKDDSITSFEKNEEEQKWIGLLVDLGVNAEIVNNDTLVIEKDLTSYGITSDTAFVIWTYKEQAGTYTFKNVEYPSDTVDLTIEFTQEKADLISTQKISIDNFDDDNDNQGIKENINNYTVSSLENTITIVDQGVQPYQLIGEDNKKWFGILVDLGVKVQGITSEQYETAAHWGATNDTTFVMWLTQNDAGTYVYRNANYPSDTVDLTIEFEYKQTSLVTFEPISVDNATQSETNIINNYGKYDTFVDNNQVIIIDNGVIPYAGGNDLVNPQKWMGFIVDFGVNVDGVSGYNIEDIDRTAARRWGATTDTAFVMWLTSNKKGFITFANKNYPEDQIEIYIDYDYTKATLVSADNLDVTNANPTQEANIINNNDKYTVTVEEDTITITDKGMLSYVGGNSSDPKKWFGYILDFGVDVDCVSGYNIEDIDRTAARRWGATTDTAFVVWMTPEKAGSYTFRNKYYSEDTITVNVVFKIS